MLSIVVVNYKNPELLRLSLKSIKEAITPDFRYEIIVVDVESSYSTANVVIEEFPGSKFVPFRKNIGYTKGVNEGIKNSSGNFVLILNADIVPLEKSIESLFDYMAENKNIGLAGPQLLNFDGSIQNSCFRFPTPLTVIYRRSFLGNLWFAKKSLENFLIENKDKTKSITVDWLMGSAFMVSKKAIEEVGLMDENFFLYMGDVDWPRRFWENGYKVVYYPLSKMYHYHRRDSKGRFGVFDLVLRKESRIHLKEAIKYFRKYGTTAPNLGN